MSSSEVYAQTSSPPTLKPIGQASPAEIRRWIDDRLYLQHSLRARDASVWRRAELYDQCVQWLRRAQAGHDGGGQYSQWVSAYYDSNDPNYIPMPVFNEGLGARQNESARLAAPNPRPKINPRSARPEVTTRQGAKRATEMLRHRLHEMGWKQQAWLMYLHMPLYGGAWVESRWDQPWDKAVMVPIQGAMACPRHPGVGRGIVGPEPGDKPCDFVLAKPAQAEQGGPAPWLASVANPVGQPVSRCPHCPDHPELVPFQPSMQEAGSMKDAQGQPLGTRQPLGDWVVTVKNPRDIFPRDMGMSMRWGEIPEWVECSTQHLDWIGERWPAKAGKVKPERATLLAQFHPVVGAPDVLNSVIDAKLFRESCRVKQWHKAPWNERIVEKNGEVHYSEEPNKGRSCIMARNEILFDGPFLLDSQTKPGETVPRVHMEYIPWEIRDGGLRLQGLGLWDINFDAADAGNEARSQTQAVRQRLAVPIYAVLRRWNMRLLQETGGIPGRFAALDTEPGETLQAPLLFNNTTIDSGVAAEIEDASRFIKSAYSDPERGNVPASMPALSIRLQKAASSEVRQPRVGRINEAMQRTFQHGSMLQCHLYVEPREFKFEGDDGEERWSSAKGLDLQFQTDVEIEAEPSFDEKAQNQETVKMLVDSRLIDPTTATKMQRRRLLTHLDAPEDLMEDEKLQEAAAQREWMSFRDEGKPPRVDPGLDSHADHFEEHGNRCQTEFFRDLEERCRWDEALKILGSNWKEGLLLLATAPMDMDRQMAMEAEVFRFPPAPMSMTQMDLQDRVSTFWGFMLLTRQFEVQDEQTLTQVLTWRSHMEAHRLLEEMSQMQAQVQPTLAQPGADETASAGQTGPGAPPEGAPA